MTSIAGLEGDLEERVLSPSRFGPEHRQELVEAHGSRRRALAELVRGGGDERGEGGVGRQRDPGDDQIPLGPGVAEAGATDDDVVLVGVAVEQGAPACEDDLVGGGAGRLRHGSDRRHEGGLEPDVDRGHSGVEVRRAGPVGRELQDGRGVVQLGRPVLDAGAVVQGRHGCPICRPRRRGVARGRRGRCGARRQSADGDRGPRARDEG